ARNDPPTKRPAVRSQRRPPHPNPARRTPLLARPILKEPRPFYRTGLATALPNPGPRWPPCTPSLPLAKSRSPRPPTLVGQDGPKNLRLEQFDTLRGQHCCEGDQSPG